MLMGTHVKDVICNNQHKEEGAVGAEVLYAVESSWYHMISPLTGT